VSGDGQLGDLLGNLLPVRGAELVDTGEHVGLSLVAKNLARILGFYQYLFRAKSFETLYIMNKCRK
jgi:hypothetical protein